MGWTLAAAGIVAAVCAGAAGEGARRVSNRWRFFAAFGAAACLEAGSALIGARLLAGVALLAIAWGACLGLVQAQRESQHHMLITARFAPAVLLVALFVAVQVATLLVRLHPPTGASAAAAAEQGSDSPPHRPVYNGVILWPDLPPQKVVAPPPRVLQPDFVATKPTDPLDIPFFGVYWFYRSPHVRPPPDSLTEHGQPTEHTFRSTDFRPISMEARQSFGRLLDLNCCRAIQIAVLNAERTPRLAWIELFAVDNRQAPGIKAFLGRAPVTSAAKLKPDGEVEPVAETLVFRIPPAPALRQFDELAIRFELQGQRSRRSINISIEKFVLIPRS
jgi:hypothetical protein